MYVEEGNCDTADQLQVSAQLDSIGFQCQFCQFKKAHHTFLFIKNHICKDVSKKFRIEFGFDFTVNLGYFF